MYSKKNAACPAQALGRRHASQVLHFRVGVWIFCRAPQAIVFKETSHICVTNTGDSRTILRGPILLWCFATLRLMYNVEVIQITGRDLHADEVMNINECFHPARRENRRENQAFHCRKAWETPVQNRRYHAARAETSGSLLSRGGGVVELGSATYQTFLPDQLWMSISFLGGFIRLSQTGLLTIVGWVGL